MRKRRETEAMNTREKEEEFTGNRMSVGNSRYNRSGNGGLTMSSLLLFVAGTLSKVKCNWDRNAEQPQLHTRSQLTAQC